MKLVFGSAVVVAAMMKGLVVGLAIGGAVTATHASLQCRMHLRPSRPGR